MSCKRKLHGATVSFNQEHKDKDGYHRCSECETKTIFVSTSGYFQVDEEPHKSGEYKTEDLPDEVFVGEVSGHFCPTCKMLVSLSYNFE